ncbi:MAG: FAD-dependent oxidoreductase [Gammaproteobacteria bacterium]|nr:FAD-dependent oxidoreductase [Gammaproteobacteria bacterium]
MIGGGFAGVTCAKYLRRFAPTIDISLITPESEYFTCPFSNTVLAGISRLEDLRQSYQALRDIHGIKVVHDRVLAVEAVERRLRLAGGSTLAYDKAVVAPGIDFDFAAVEGLTAENSPRMPHAWKAGAQTAQLSEHIRAMKQGGTIAISVPPAPFRCPPGPYERASLIAWYLQQHNPGAKVLILDGNDSFSKQGLFTAAWQHLFPGMIEWIPISQDGAVRRVDTGRTVLYTEIGEHAVDVANVIPPQRAAALARDSGLTDASGWCPVDPETFASTLADDVYVLGDAAKVNPMPKSASAANSHGKQCAIAIAAALTGQNKPPVSLHNTCYSLVTPAYGISVSAIYRMDNGALASVAGAGGTSPADAAEDFRRQEADYARGWYASICADSFG